MSNKNIWFLPTDKLSRLHFDGKLFLSTNPQISREINSIVQGRNIYITNSEKIEKGDWVFNPIYKTVYQWIINADLHFDKISAKKIILTTDTQLIEDGVQSIPDYFLEWFVNNSSCEEVKVKHLLKSIFNPKTNEKYPIVQHRHFDLTKMICTYHYELIIPRKKPNYNMKEEIIAEIERIEEPEQKTFNVKTEKQKPIQLRNSNLPAFPTEFSYGDEDFTGQPIINKKKYAGVTKREYFTAKALGGFMAKHGAVDFSEADADRIMVAVDMMLAKCKML